MPLRLPKAALPPFPDLGNNTLNEAFEAWRRDVSDIFSRDFQEIENFAYGQGFRALRLTSATIPPNVATAVDLDFEDFDTDRMFSTAAPYGTVNTPGIYIATGRNVFKAGGSGTYRQTSLWIDGVQPFAQHDSAIRVGGGQQVISVAEVNDFPAGARVQLIAQHDSTANLGVGGSTVITPSLAMVLLTEIPPP